MSPLRLPDDGGTPVACWAIWRGKAVKGIARNGEGCEGEGRISTTSAKDDVGSSHKTTIGSKDVVDRPGYIHAKEKDVDEESFAARY